MKLSNIKKNAYRMFSPLIIGGSLLISGCQQKEKISLDDYVLNNLIQNKEITTSEKDFLNDEDLEKTFAKLYLNYGKNTLTDILTEDTINFDDLNKVYYSLKIANKLDENLFFDLFLDSDYDIPFYISFKNDFDRILRRIGSRSKFEEKLENKIKEIIPEKKGHQISYENQPMQYNKFFNSLILSILAIATSYTVATYYSKFYSEFTDSSTKEVRLSSSMVTGLLYAALLPLANNISSHPSYEKDLIKEINYEVSKMYLNKVSQKSTFYVEPNMLEKSLIE